MHMAEPMAEVTAGLEANLPEGRDRPLPVSEVRLALRRLTQERHRLDPPDGGKSPTHERPDEIPPVGREVKIRLALRQLTQERDRFGPPGGVSNLTPRWAGEIHLVARGAKTLGQGVFDPFLTDTGEAFRSRHGEAATRIGTEITSITTAGITTIPDLARRPS
jgi:hypothetical protein